MENCKNLENKHSNSEIIEAVNESAPNIVSRFTPENAEFAKSEFLENRNLEKPNNFYENLNQESIDNLREKVFATDSLVKNTQIFGKIEQKLYEEKIDSHCKSVELLQAVVDVRNAKNGFEKSRAEEKFMRINIEQYGEPEISVFESLMNDKLSSIDVENLDEKGRKIYKELFLLLDKNYTESCAERFKPKSETIERFGGMVRSLYSRQLDFVPEKSKNGDKYSAEEIFETFENVVKDFEEVANFQPYQVAWRKSGAINVNQEQKSIFIPKDRPAISRSKLEGLLVHEIGTHYYRAQIGEMYGIEPLRTGLNYLDTEEGVARAMEMAVRGEYQEAGVQHYITAGLAYFEGKNFREVFETNWRMGILSDGKNDFSDENIAKKQSFAYRNTQRIFRGTDELPWFKDLSYFNGGQKVWKYIEENINSPDLMQNLLLGGKNDLFNSGQQRNIYEFKNGKR